MNQRRLPPSNPRPTMLLALAALAGACQTQEIDANHLLRGTGAPTEENDARLVLSISGDYATPEQEQYALTHGQEAGPYHLRIDGRTVMRDQDDFILWGGTAPIWVPSGLHVFEVIDEGGRATLRSEPYELMGDHLTHIVAFGSRHAMQARFVAQELAVPPGTLRYSVVNLVRDQTIEVVSCPEDDAANCTRIGDALAYGEVSQGEAARDPAAPAPYLNAAQGIHFRVAPTPTLPAPLIGNLYPDLGVWPNPPSRSSGQPIFMAAPVFIDAGSGGALEYL